jgi:adenylate cyclase
VDWEGEGLLAGAESGAARADRIGVLEKLFEAGVPLDELKRALAEDRLTVMPAERVLSGGASRTAEDVAREAGVDQDLLRSVWQAAGLPDYQPGERAFSERDVEAAKLLKRFFDAGLAPDRILQVARVMGQGMANTAAATRALAAEAFTEEGMSEGELGRVYAEATLELTPLIGPLLEQTYMLHLREGVRRDVVTRTERERGSLGGASDVAVCFADLVDFTRLGETLPAAEIGRVAARLAELAISTVGAPVRLVKTIGDAVMLVSPETPPLLESVLELLDRVEAEESGFPQLRAGVAYGPAYPSGGDWYGRSVNLASRVTGVARPATVVVTEETRDTAGDEFSFAAIGRRRLKGIERPVRLHRVRRRRRWLG